MNDFALNKSMFNAALRGDAAGAVSALRAGADPDAKNAEGRTALHVAASYGHLGVIEAMLDEGIEIGRQGNGKTTALHCAASANRARVVKALIEKGADIDARDNGGWTPLHHAAMGMCKEVAEALLDGGADIHARDKQGMTPLHSAITYDRRSTVKLLLDRGAGNHIRNKDGMTPVQYARHCGHLGLTEGLRAYFNERADKADMQRHRQARRFAASRKHLGK